MPVQPTPLHPAAAYVLTEDGAVAARAFLDRMPGAGAERIHFGGVAVAGRLVGTPTLGRDVLVEVGDPPNPADLDCLREIAAGVDRLFVVGAANDVALFRRIRALGAADYLPLPLDPAEDFGRSGGEGGDQGTARPGRTVGVVGTVGGVGATMLAVNLAWHLADRDGARLALVDGDMTAATIAVDLDTTPTPGLVEALRDPDRVDEVFLNAVMASPRPGLHLLSAERDWGSLTPGERAGFAGLVARLRRHFDPVILDLPRSLLLSDPDLLDTVDQVLMVLSPGLPALRAHGRLADHLARRTPPVSVRPVLSMARADAGLTLREIEAALQGRVAQVLPHSPMAPRAAVGARPLVEAEPRGAYARGVRALAAALTGDAAAVSAPSVLRRLVGRLR